MKGFVFMKSAVFLPAFPFIRFTRLGILTIILLLSFLLKVLLRFYLTPPAIYWASGYDQFYVMAKNWLKTGMLYLPVIGDSVFGQVDIFYASRPPVYPLFLMISGFLTHFSPLGHIIIQTLLSTLTVYLCYRLGRAFAGEGAGLWAAFFYAFFPYALFHDTQIQENVLLNFLSLSSVSVLGLSIEKQKAASFFLLGILLGLATLTRVSFLIPAALCVLYLFLKILHSTKRFNPKVLLVLLGMLFFLIPWLTYTKITTGNFMISSLSGWNLTEAHNAFTFRFYPYEGSIDQSSEAFMNWFLTQPEMKDVEGIRSEAALNSFWVQYGWNYIQTHKLQTIVEGVCKVAVNFIGLLSPQQSFWKNWSYFLAYWGMTIFACFSFSKMWKSDFFRIFILFSFGQAVVSFIYWAHTSHRSFLDPLLAILAGIGLSQILSKKNICPAKKLSFALDFRKD